jgi:hypothetical protein
VCLFSRIRVRGEPQSERAFSRSRTQKYAAMGRWALYATVQQHHVAVEQQTLSAFVRRCQQAIARIDTRTETN